MGKSGITGHGYVHLILEPWLFSTLAESQYIYIYIPMMQISTLMSNTSRCMMRLTEGKGRLFSILTESL